MERDLDEKLENLKAEVENLATELSVKTTQLDALLVVKAVYEDLDSREG